MAKKTSLPSGFTSKTNFQILPGVPAGKKVNAATEWNLGIQDLADTADENYERLILNWTNDIVVDQVLALGQYIDYNDQNYRVTTSYDVSNPKTFTAGNFQLLNLDLNTWYANPNGDDTTGNGSPSKPFETIQAAIDVLNSGDTVVLANGDYPDDFTIDANINFVSFGAPTGRILGAVIDPSTVTINGGIEVSFTNVWLKPTVITQGSAGDVYIYATDCKVNVTTITGLTLKQYQANNCTTWFSNDLTVISSIIILGGTFISDNLTLSAIGVISFAHVEVFIHGNLIKSSTGSLIVEDVYLNVDGNIDVGSEDIAQRNSVITVTGTITGTVVPELQVVQKRSIGPTLSIPFSTALITEITPLTITGPTEFTVDTTDAEYGNMTFRRVTADGTNIPTFQSPFQKWLASRDYDNTAGIVNVMAWWFDGISYYYSIGQAEQIVLPIMTGLVVAADNETCELSFNVATYANDDGTGDLQLSDFGTATLTGGTATSPVLSNPVHSAGDSSITFDLSYTGEADGDEVLEIPVADGASIYDVGGTAMDSGESAVDNLNIVVDVNLLAGWDAADDSSVITANGSVTSWADQTDNNEDLAESTDTPVHSSAGDTVTFTGVSTSSHDILSKVIAAFEFQQSDDFTIFIENLIFASAGTGTAQHPINNKISTDNNSGWSINTSGDGLTLFFSHHDNSTQNFASWAPGGGFIDDASRNIIFINESGTLKIYDATNTNVGSNGTTSIGTITYGAAKFKIGVRQASTSSAPFKGSMKGVKVWDKALSAGERDTELGL